MNRYDKEERIINKFQTLKINEIKFFSKNLQNFLAYLFVHNEKLWNSWIDSSAKNELPPDFFNIKLKLMMDVMRIDDHAYLDEKGRVINRCNERESKLIEELISKNPNFKEVAEEGRLFINPDSGLKGEQDHNYSFYVNNFKRVVGKHIKKIDKYKKNHPGYKIIFFIFDESSPYIKLINHKKPEKVGEVLIGDLHLWWKDNNMLNIIKNSNIDYLIWMTPYKIFLSLDKVSYPRAAIYDVSKIRFNKLSKYEIEDLVSIEL